MSILRRGLLFSFCFFSFLKFHMLYAEEVAFERQFGGLPIVYLDVAIQKGSLSDPPGQMGLTRFMGEMLLRGGSKTKKQVDEALDQMGAELKLEVRTEALILRGAVLSDKLDPFLELVCEILTKPFFPMHEIKKLQFETLSLIQEELAHDGALAAQKFNEYLFGAHPYGKSVLGKTKDVKSFTKSMVEEQYRHVIQGQKLIVVGSGSAFQERIEAWASQVQSQLLSGKKGSLSFSIAKFSDPTSFPKEGLKKRLKIINKPDRTQTQIYGGQVGITMVDPDFFSLYLGNHAFGGASFSAILMKEIRVKRGWSYGATSLFRYGVQPKSWFFHLYPAEKDTPAALALTLGLIEKVKKEGISRENFEFSQQSLINNSGFMYNTPKKRVENILNEKILGLPDDFFKHFRQSLEKLEYGNVNAALSRFFRPTQMAVLVLGTANALKEGLSRSLGIPYGEIEVVDYTEE